MKLSKRLKTLEASHSKALGAQNVLENRCSSLEEILCELFVCATVSDKSVDDIRLMLTDYLSKQQLENGEAGADDSSEATKTYGGEAQAESEVEGAPDSNNGSGEREKTVAGGGESTVENKGALQQELAHAKKQVERHVGATKELREQIKKLRASLADKRGEETDFQQKLNTAEEKVVLLKLRLDKLKAEKEQEGKIHSKLLADYKNISGELATAKRKYESERKAVGAKSKDVEGLQRRVKSIEGELNDSQLLCAEKTSLIGTMREKMSQRNIQAQESKLSDVSQEAADLRTEVSAKQSECESLKRRLQEANKAVSEALRESQTLRNENDEAKSRDIEGKSVVKRLQSKLGIAISNSKESQLEAEAAKLAEAEMAKKVEIANAQLNALRGMVDELTAEKKTVEERAIALRNGLESEKAMKAGELEEARHAMDVLKTTNAKALADQERQLKATFQKEMERTKLAAQKKSSQAIRLVQEKDSELSLMKKQNMRLKDEVESGRPEERLILEYAADQARRESQTRLVMNELDSLKEKLKEREATILRLQKQAASAASQGGGEGGGYVAQGPTVNLIYLKNVIAQFMSFQEGSSERMRLVPVIATILRDIKKMQPSTTK
jgi:chromosome segregation ATPase